APARAEVLIQAGYVWLFVVSGFFLIRTLMDPVMVRRPLLEPNLSASGLTFTGISLLIFLMANVIMSPLDRLERKMALQEAPEQSNPGFEPFYKFSDTSYQTNDPVDPAQPEARRQAMIRAVATRTVTIMAHLAVVIGIVWIGFRHFGSIHTGVAAATLYLLTFYTSQFTSQMDHVVPAMLLVWAIATYRRPTIAGILIGLAGGLIYYPLFLLPLWCGFYWRRGMFRFIFGVVLALSLLVGILALMSRNEVEWIAQLKQMFGWRNPFDADPTGFWQHFEH
ncbi:unnamed protein product, partial [marine sediment metagenome]